jgi:uncharacterized protein (DUF3820 family)
MIMPFGKHKGHRVSDIPTLYLRWMLREVYDLDPQLRRAAKAALHVQEMEGCPNGQSEKREQPACAVGDGGASRLPTLATEKRDDGKHPARHRVGAFRRVQVDPRIIFVI